MAHNPQKAPSAPMTQDNALTAPIGARQRAKPPRIHQKTRRAIDLLVTTGRTQREVAEEVGLNEKSLSRSLRKPHVAAYFEEQKVLALQELKMLRKKGEIAAIHVALDLLHNAKSETTRVKMVEFFGQAAARQGPQTVVNVGNNTIQGYEMARPGQRIVDITPDRAENHKQVTRSQHDDSDESQ